MKVLAIALNTFREAIRNKILYSVVLFAVLIVGVSALFSYVTIGDHVKVIKDFGLFSLSFFGAIIAIVSGTSLLNKELKLKTIYNIVSKPVARWQFILGKHLGLSATVCVLVALMGLALTAFVSLFENRIDWLLFEGILFAMFEAVVVAAVAIFFSSLVVTTTLTAIFTLGTYIAGRSIAYLSYFMSGEHATNPVLTQLVKILNYVLPDLSVFNINNALVYGQSVSSAHLLTAALYCVSYSTAALCLASLIFEKRELT